MLLDKRTRRLGGRNAGVSQSHVHRQKTLLQTESRRLSDHLSAVEEVSCGFHFSCCQRLMSGHCFRYQASIARRAWGDEKIVDLTRVEKPVPNFANPTPQRVPLHRTASGKLSSIQTDHYNFHAFVSDILNVLVLATDNHAFHLNFTTQSGLKLFLPTFSSPGQSILQVTVVVQLLY